MQGHAVRLSRGTTALTPTTLRRAADPAILKKLADTSGAFVIALFDSSPDCIQLIELDGSLSYMNPNGQCAMEIDDFDSIAGKPYVTLWPKESQVKVSLAVAAAKVGEPSRIETFIPRGDGSAHWWDLSISPVLGPRGEVARILSIARDVTPVVEREHRLRDYERKLTDLNASLTEELGLRDVLMREIDHRVKNSLSMVASMLRLQARNTDSEEAAKRIMAAAGRVSIVARVHEGLQVSEDVSAVELNAYLPVVIGDVSDALSRDDVSITFQIDPVSVPSEMAVALGLITAELVTNALKHAFGPDGGQVRIGLRRQSDDTLRLTVTDDGQGGFMLKEGGGTDAVGGLGTRIVQLQVAQLHGSFSSDSTGAGGTTITLDVPFQA